MLQRSVSSTVVVKEFDSNLGAACGKNYAMVGNDDLAGSDADFS